MPAIPAPERRPAATLLTEHASLLRDYLRSAWNFIDFHGIGATQITLLITVVGPVALAACITAPLWLTLGAIWQTVTGVRPHGAQDVAPYLEPQVQEGRVTWLHDRSVPMRLAPAPRAAALALALPLSLLIISAGGLLWTRYGHAWAWYAHPLALLLLAGAVNGFAYYVTTHLNRADPVRAIEQIGEASQTEIPSELFDLWEATYPHLANTSNFVSAETRYSRANREIEAFLLPYREWIVGNPAAVLRAVQGYWATLKQAQKSATPALTRASSQPMPEVYIDFTQELAPAEPQKSAEERYQRARKQLHHLIGLDAVKQNIDALANLVRIGKLRQEQGLAAAPVGRHLVFTGNPGTGKTTVARLVAEIYHAMGLLPSSRLVEVDRGGLVAGYVGQTAIKTQAVIDRAIGGVLFIDEAYALTPKSANDYGHEAIETLLKAMEDHRDDLVVIVAGYHDKMQDFLASNPGLPSRFNHFVHFDDYSPGEMLQITLSMLEQNGYTPSLEAADQIHRTLTMRHGQRERTWANGRDARRLFDEIITRQASRLATVERPSKSALSRIEAADVPPR